MQSQPAFEKNYFLALGLSMLVLIAYFSFVKPPTPENAMVSGAEETTFQETISDESQKVSPVVEKAAQEITSSVKKTSEATTTMIEEVKVSKTATFENAFLRAEFSSLGGTITDLFYKGEQDREEWTQTEFFSFDPSVSGAFGVDITNTAADFSHTIFDLKETSKGPRFVFENEEYKLVKQYIFNDEAPSFGIVFEIENKTQVAREFPIKVEYAMEYKEDIQIHAGEYFESVIFTNKIKSQNVHKIEKKGFSVSEKAAWAGLVKQYFAILVKPDGKIIEARNSASNNFMKSAIHLEPVQVLGKSKTQVPLMIYAGPQRYETLKNFEAGLESVLARGFFGMFKMWLLHGMKFFYNFTGNFGWAIILLTILLKLIFAPLTHISSSSMKKMQALSPKQKAIQDRYKDEPQKAQKEIMALYKRNKVNPMMGCLPMLIQFPILIAMFRLLPEAIELHGAPFILWIHDLSAPDHFFQLPFEIPFLGEYVNLLPLLMIVSQLGYQKIMPTMNTQPEQAMIMKLMPWIFGIICYKFSSGLVLYWIFQNLISMAQQMWMNRDKLELHPDDMVDDTADDD